MRQTPSAAGYFYCSQKNHYVHLKKMYINKHSKSTNITAEVDELGAELANSVSEGQLKNP